MERLNNNFTIATPILFRSEYQKFVNQVLSHIIGVSNITYVDNQPYSINKISQQLFGFNAFQVTGIFGLAFLASIGLVTVILPSLYFHILLITDKANNPQVIRQRIDVIQKLSDQYKEIEMMSNETNSTILNVLNNYEKENFLHNPGWKDFTTIK